MKCGRKPGSIPWNKGTKGLVKPNSGSFKKGYKQKKGSEHYHWKGGKTIREGYNLVYKPHHPFSDVRGWIREYRLVVEKQIGRHLLTSEIVHHLGKKSDDRPQMLMAFNSQSAHIRFEHYPNRVKPKEIIFDGRKLNHLNTQRKMIY